ncbi:MAG: glutamine--fructose-6-phosphate transaminase (isomerizing) [Gammaproteobacteria bacterium]|nr:MAG: glutamine--fructose-6-phosphate transaminase (isomerizing) [Gammaproteobacteria bacterium]
MCGIIGAVAQRDVTAILLEGLKRLEYRGYDSAGIAVLDKSAKLQRVRVAGKIKDLEQAINRTQLLGQTGIAHTRWATHGKPTIENAHPQICRDQIALVHNGIIENHEKLREQQKDLGYEFTSDTDSEVVVNQIYHHLEKDGDLLSAVVKTIAILKGAYALGVINRGEPDRIIATRSGSPLVIGVGIGEHFIASDVFALLPVTRQFIFLEEGDIADIRRDSLSIYDKNQNRVQRPVRLSELGSDVADKAGFRHYMLKEIFEQPTAIANTLEGRLDKGLLVEDMFGHAASNIFNTVDAIQIVACGTSYHAGLVAKYWVEDIARIPCQVEVASEFRYRDIFVPKNTLFVTISQSGETADTLAALKKAKESGFVSTLTICNVAESSMTRESELVFLTRAGAEIGVASTKAFTTQLVSLLLLILTIARRHGMESKIEKEIISQLESLPGKINSVLELNDQIRDLANQFASKNHALYLGRGTMLPVAMEGALKLKEISYIHAEAYPAGELKHGPLALVDDEMPVIAVAPNNALLEKLKSNLYEVRARGGKLYVITDTSARIDSDVDIELLKISPVNEYMSPIVYTVPLQLLSYHVAVLKGADVDQPRNLAKSVTVE